MQRTCRDCNCSFVMQPSATCCRPRRNCGLWTTLLLLLEMNRQLSPGAATFLKVPATLYGIKSSRDAVRHLHNAVELAATPGRARLDLAGIAGQLSNSGAGQHGCAYRHSLGP